MNILIVGEFSAFAHHLKAGFVALGHDVCVVTHGDGFKKLDGDYDDIKYNIPKDISLFGRTIKKSHLIINPFVNKTPFSFSIFVCLLLISNLFNLNLDDKDNFWISLN